MLSCLCILFSSLLIHTIIIILSHDHENNYIHKKQVLKQSTKSLMMASKVLFSSFVEEFSSSLYFFACTTYTRRSLWILSLSCWTHHIIGALLHIAITFGVLCVHSFTTCNISLAYISYWVGSNWTKEIHFDLIITNCKFNPWIE